MVARKWLINSRCYWNHFKDGLIKPSLPALIGTVIVTISAFGLCLMLITPQFMATKGYGYFRLEPTDEYGHLTSEVLRIKQLPFQQMSVALIGASALREAISDVTDLRRLLEAQLGKPISSYDLMTGALSHWEARCIVDNLSEQFHGVVVLAISPNTLTRSKDFLAELARYPRLALDCPSFDEELRLAGLAVPKRLNNYFLNHYQFFVARQDVLFNLFTRHIPLERHKVAKWQPIMNQNRWQLLIQQLKKWHENYSKYNETNWNVYTRLIQQLQSTNRIRVALVESIRNPAVEAIIYATSPAKQLYEQYQHQVKQFAQQNQVAYWNIGTIVKLQPEDFVDHTHIQNPLARKRYTAALATLLVNLFSTP